MKRDRGAGSAPCDRGEDVDGVVFLEPGRVPVREVARAPSVDEYVNAAWDDSVRVEQDFAERRLLRNDGFDERLNGCGLRQRDLQ